ncbi:MAG: DUF1440 domain-containing protein [Pseudomonadota bacterium]|nr:DUF1440 domain-containing protein [Pseudomonadota bacterium]
MANVRRGSGTFLLHALHRSGTQFIPQPLIGESKESTEESEMQDQIELERGTAIAASSQEDAAEKGYGPIAKALMGAAAGAAGTFALDRTDWLMWNHEDEQAKAQTNSVRPYGEPPAHVTAHKAEEILGVEPTPEQHEIAGVAIHYNIGIGPAIVYALVRDKLPIKGIPRGLLYGLGIFAVQDEILNSASGLGANLKKYPWQAHARGLFSHLAYGVATELMLNFMERSVKARRLGPLSGSDAQGAPRAAD